MLNNTFAGKKLETKIIQPSDNTHNKLSNKKNRLQQQQPIYRRTSSPNQSSDLSATQELVSSGFSIVSQPQRNSSPTNVGNNFSLRLVY